MVAGLNRVGFGLLIADTPILCFGPPHRRLFGSCRKLLWPHRPRGCAQDESPASLDRMWTESKKLTGKTWRIWKTAARLDASSHCHISFLGFPYRPLAMCKLGKLSFVAGAEVPKQYVLGS